MENRNVETVQAIYGAFKRGDIPAILDRLAEDAAWGFNASHTPVPWHTTVHGKRGVSRYFGALIEGAQVHRMEPVALLGGGNQVAAQVELELTVRKTGQTVTTRQVHWWTFDRTGKVVRMLQFEDTAATIAAWNG